MKYLNKLVSLVQFLYLTIRWKILLSLNGMKMKIMFEIRKF